MGYIKICLVAVILAFGVSCSAAKLDYRITQDGKPLAAIVIGADATLPEQNAAKELSSYLNHVTGASFPLYAPGAQPSGMRRILVGQSVESKRLLGDIDWEKLKFDGIAIKFVGNDLVLAGDRPRGTVYAVYTFLEEYVGCKWWTPKASYVPRKRDLSVKIKDQVHVSPFLYRETFYGPVLRKNMDFAVKLKLNGHFEPVAEDMGGHYNLLGFVHTAYTLLPPAVYFKDHPEWYSLIDGKRTGVEAQLCLSNEEMKKELIKQAMKLVDENPEAGMISISQNDGYNPCQCDKCQAIVKEEGSESGPIIRFVNSVAEELEKKHPGILVETLAYVYGRKAPKLVKPRSNVIVRLCSIECDFARPLDSKINASFYKDLTDWAKISKRLFVWDYVVNFGDLLVGHPNWNVIAPNIRMFAKNSVVGLFEQGDGYNTDAVFGNMKIWVISHLMWNPDLDQRRLMKEFANGYYGPAAPYLLKYLDLTSDAIDRSKEFLGCFNGVNMSYMTQKDMDGANDLFDSAEKSVRNNPALLHRVKLERMALDYMWIQQIFYDRSRVGEARGIGMNAICNDFIKQAPLTGNDYIHEAATMTKEYYNTLRSYAAVQVDRNVKRATTIPSVVRKLKRDRWMDIQEDEMYLHQFGTVTTLVGDSTASNGKAAYIPGSSPEWAVQLKANGITLPENTKATIYVSVRVKAKAATGPAFSIGIYDDASSRQIMRKVVNIEDLHGKDGYIDYNLGTYSPGPNWFAYVAAPGDGNLVEGVYVDRFYVVLTK